MAVSNLTRTGRLSKFILLGFGIIFLVLVLTFIEDDIFLFKEENNGVTTTTNGNDDDHTTTNSSRSPTTIKEKDLLRLNATATKNNNNTVITLKTEENEEDTNKKVQNVINNSSSNNNNNSSSSSSMPQPVVIPIVTQLAGEMGNQLSYMVHGFALSWMLEDEYNISSRVILRHQEHNKWKGARQTMVQCFPNLRHLDFEEGNTPEFDTRRIQQQEWLGKKYHNKLTESQVQCYSEDCFKQQLDLIQHIVTNQIYFNNSLSSKERLDFSNTTIPIMFARPAIPNDANITLPFIHANTFSSTIMHIIDRYYDRIKELFEYDTQNPKCCNQEVVPRDDEVALHIRGFTAEMPRNGIKKGYQEISPNKTVYELLRPDDNNNNYYNTTTNFTLIGRFHTAIVSYTNTMKDIGNFTNTRDVTDKTLSGTQAFCFLLSIEREIIGMSMSTYIQWAAILGKARSARIYSMLYKDRIERFGGGAFYQYNFTRNSRLKEKFSFESYTTEEEDIMLMLQHNKTGHQNRLRLPMLADQSKKYVIAFN